MKAIVIGAGISGLSCAYLLQKEGFDVVVLEKEDYVGGKIRTIKENDYLIEAGPNGFLYSENTIRFIEQAGFSHDLIEAKQSSNRKFIYDGRLYEIPQKQQKLLFDNFLSIKSKLALLKEPFVKPNPDDETVAEFVIRRLGKEFLDKLIGPMSLGIYAADPYTMSITSNFKRIKEIESTYGSLIKGLVKLMSQKKANASSASGQFSKQLYSFKDGMQSFIEHLAQSINVLNGYNVKSIEKTSKYVIYTDSAKFDADIVVFAAPSFEVAKIIENLDKQLPNYLISIPYSPIVLVALAFSKKFANNTVGSYGYLFDLNKINSTIGVLFDSSIFDYRSSDDRFLVRMFLGGALRQGVIQKNNLEVLQSAIAELQRSAKIFAPFEYYKIIKYTKAIPQYLMDHKEIINLAQAFESKNPGIYFVGNAFYGVGFNDCINNSYNLIKKIKSI
ncbi:Protoporphyrinogen 9 oxidase, aerobic, HemY [Desulfurella amilsii]|uniref:Coproporphyrinogen III oxidase n=1 Tax=Desulfurella amilsii TaxID=1562698 RepID=A0A1X4XWG4_9BACT|nr:protoporphyrinogen oxidase [Desulfurella amilsii]OSS41865.1 Protoporphyrinogen 9 oxidase, aerobic, HemY [Desulfurella amilsii]